MCAAGCKPVVALLPGESADNLALMRRIDELHMDYPFYGSRQMMQHLCREGVTVGDHRIRRLMAVMGMEAIYRGRGRAWRTRSTGAYHACSKDFRGLSNPANLP